MNEPILPAVAAAQMCADTVLGARRVWVIAVIQDHQLDIAKDGFNGIVIRATFG